MSDVSVIVVAQNEARYISECLNSIIKEFKSFGLTGEIVVIDGESSDETVSLARQVLTESGITWRLLSNPRRTLASGWNLGILNAECEFVVRPDAHAELKPGYILKGIEILQKMPDVVAVGGSLETRTKFARQRYFAYALSSKVGVGNSPFRTSSDSKYADTAVYAVYRRKAIIDVGGLNEDLVRHQDNDLHERLRRAGWRFYQSGEMHATYYCRDSLRKIAAQMFAIGKHLPSLWFGEGGTGVKVRHLAPVLFVLALILNFSLFFAGLDVFWMLVLPSAYVFALVVDAVIGSFRSRDWLRLRTVEVIPVMHLCYGFGTLVGLFRLLSVRT